MPPPFKPKRKTKAGSCLYKVLGYDPQLYSWPAGPKKTVGDLKKAIGLKYPHTTTINGKRASDRRLIRENVAVYFVPDFRSKAKKVR